MTPRCFALVPLAGLILGTTVVTAAPVTYQLKDWGSYLAQTHLQGSITVDDTDGNRLIAPGEVVDWSFTGTVIPAGPSSTALHPFTLLHEPGAQPLCRAGGCFLLDGLDLVLNIQTQGPTEFTDAAGNRFDVSGDSGLRGDAVAGDRVAAMRWTGGAYVGATMASLLDAPLMRIATIAGTVAEPSSLALVLAALAAATSAAGMPRRGSRYAAA
jgi:hypothetical protein